MMPNNEEQHGHVEQEPQEQQSADSRLAEDADIDAATEGTRSEAKDLLGLPAQDRAFIEQFRKSGMNPEEIKELYDQLHPEKVYADPIMQKQADETRSRVLHFIRSGETSANKLTDDDIRKIGLDAAIFMRNDPSANFMALRFEEGPDGQLIDLQVDPDVGERFDAHGIRKGNEEAQLRSLLSFLDNGIDMTRALHSAPLELRPEKKNPGLGSTGGTVDKESSCFLIMGGIDMPLVQGIRNVIVMPPFHAHIGKLRAAYPNVTFIASNQAKTILADIAAKQPK